MFVPSNTVEYYFFWCIEVIHSELFSTVLGSEGEQSIFSVYILNLFVWVEIGIRI